MTQKKNVKYATLLTNLFFNQIRLPKWTLYSKFISSPDFDAPLTLYHVWQSLIMFMIYVNILEIPHTKKTFNFVLR